MLQPRRQVGSFPEATAAEEPGPRVLLGIKNCDLIPLKVHDTILGEGEFKDPFYLAQRKSTILVAADCPEPEQSCFCNLLGLTPYSQDGADAALTIVDGNWLFDIGESGQQRAAAVATLNLTNARPWNSDLSGAVAAKRGDDAFWSKHAEKCVECFGCLMGCPTCYCFLLYDQAKEKDLKRTRVWDACYLAAYARVGGGANPRAEFVKRFANRFICKFSDFKADHGMYACSGCGRCFKACMGKIDIRKVLAEL
jgi:sulfhydrogenase subunit beta (sulfur reductase)